MHSRAWPAVALLLLVAALAAPAAQAAVDAHPRTSPTQALPGAITGFAVAGNGAVAAGMNDTGRTLGQSTADPVWTWWDASGSSIRNDRADENNCGGTGIAVTPLEPCIGDVMGIALSADGTRIAVAARGNANTDGRLLLLNSQSGPVANFELPSGESPTSLAMSPDGTRIALGLLRPEGASPDLGRVRLYTWPSPGNSPLATWSSDTAFPVTDVAVGADGKVTAVASDRNYRFTTSGGSATAFMHDTDATLNAVAMASAGPAHWSVAVAQDGGILLYSDAQDGANPVAAYDLQPGASPQRAASMSSDAKLLAIGDAAGIVRLLRNPDLVAGAATIGQTTALDGAVTALQLSPDGSHLAVAAGRGTYLYRTSNAGLSEIWRDVGTAAVTQVGLSSDAEFVASASGSAVTVFTATHAVGLAVPASTPVTPGTPATITLTLSNTGNRDEVVPLAVSKPADWTAALGAASITVAAGSTATVSLNVTAPDFATPGAAAVQVTHRVRGIPTTTSVNLVVEQLRAWALSSDGAINRGVDAGGSVRFQLRLQNLGNGADTTDLQATVDQTGWTAAVTPATMTLARGATGYANLTLTAPATAPNGASALATVRLDADPTAALQLGATVGARFGVAAIAVPASSSGPAGQAATFVVRITNNGNAPDTYNLLEGAVPTGWLMVADGDQARSSVAPGASVEIPVTVTPPAGAAPATYQLTVRVESLGDASKTATARHDFAIDGSSVTTTSSKSKGSPGPAFALSVVALAALVAWTRRTR